MELSVGTKKINSEFVVTTSGRCLLGHITSRDLGPLRIGLSASSETAECNVIGKDLASAPQTKYPKVFSGIDKIKEYRLKLHVDPEVTPVAQKPRRVPFALCEKVTAKVEGLISQRHSGTGGWADILGKSCGGCTTVRGK